MELLQYEDGIWALVVLALTEVAKRLRPVGRRWLPLVPLAIAMPIGLLAASQEPWQGWTAFLLTAASKGLKAGSMAMAGYKLWRTTLRGA